MNIWLNKKILYIANSVTGAFEVVCYWKFVGCVTGTCAITSKPLNSTIYFAVMGAIVFGMFKKENKQQEQH